MGFEALTQYLDALPEKNIPGCDLIVSLGHEIVYRHCTGEGRPGQPMRGDEAYWFYSATKVYTVTAAMQLIESGRLHLDTPVADVLPEFARVTVQDGDRARPPKTVMTVEHLMTMQAGFDYELDTPAIRACVEKYVGRPTTRQVVAAFAEKPLGFDPGTRFCYSLCHDVLAAVIEAVSGLTFGEYLHRNLFVPLGITGLTMHPSPAFLDEMASCWIWDDAGRLFPFDGRANRYRLSPAYESGGAGLYGTVKGYFPLIDALANGGTGANGVQILSRASIDEMRRDRLGPAARADYELMHATTGYSYGLGVRTLVEKAPSRSPLGEFGWDGAGGAWALSDPKNRLAAFYAQSVMNCGRSYDEFHPAIRDLIYDALGLGE